LIQRIEQVKATSITPFAMVKVPTHHAVLIFDDTIVGNQNGIFLFNQSAKVTPFFD
jgi:hypothetical protein